MTARIIGALMVAFGITAGVLTAQGPVGPPERPRTLPVCETDLKASQKEVREVQQQLLDAMWEASRWKGTATGDITSMRIEFAQIREARQRLQAAP